MPTPPSFSGFDPSFADRANDLFCVLDLRGHVTYVNAPVARLTQRSAPELLDRPALDLVAAVHRDEVGAFYARSGSHCTRICACAARTSPVCRSWRAI
jgi:PAS domain-containing protein